VPRGLRCPGWRAGPDPGPGDRLEGAPGGLEGSALLVEFGMAGVEEPERDAGLSGVHGVHDLPGEIRPVRLDYTALDRLIPHPAYAAQAWVSILNPGEATAGQARALLTDAHARAVRRHDRRRSGKRGVPRPAR
jgi:hypothetical protein